MVFLLLGLTKKAGAAKIREMAEVAAATFSLINISKSNVLHEPFVSKKRKVFLLFMLVSAGLSGKFCCLDPAMFFVHKLFNNNQVHFFVKGNVPKAIKK